MDLHPNPVGGYLATGNIDYLSSGSGDQWVLELDDQGQSNDACTLAEATNVTVTDTLLMPVDTTETAVPASLVVSDTAVTPVATTLILG